MRERACECVRDIRLETAIGNYLGHLQIVLVHFCSSKQLLHLVDFAEIISNHRKNTSLSLYHPCVNTSHKGAFVAPYYELVLFCLHKIQT